MRITTLLLLFIIGCFANLNAQILEPVTWSFDTNQVGPDEHILIFKADIEKPWKVYSQFTSDGGPVPTSITYESGNIEVIDDTEEVGDKKQGIDKMFDVEVIAFTSESPFFIKHKVKLTDPSKPIQGYLTFMTCNDETCLPPTDVDFKFTFRSIKTPTKKNRNPDGTIVDPNLEAPIKTKKAVPKTNVQDVKVDVTPVAPVKDIPIEKIPIVDAIEEDIKINSTAIAPVEENIIEPVKWHFNITSDGDNNYSLHYTADMEEEWTVYSMYTDDNGPYPTYITYENEKALITVGDAMEKGHKKEGPDPLFDNVNVIKYLSDEPFSITQKITSPNKQKIKGYLTYMACNNEGCLPPTDVDFVYNVKKMKGMQATAEMMAAAAATSGVTKLNVKGNYVDQRIPQMTETYADPVGDCKGGEETEDRGLLMSFFFGFIGGLLALLTPCVFPMIPLTVSFFTKDTKRKGWVNGAIYGLSIIVIYVGLGILITAALGPDALNRLSTNWIANTIFFLIFVLFAFSFFGFYEIRLPSSWSTKSDTMADKGGLIGIFFMAFTLALVSFSCTGPIIGSALVSSATNPLGPAIVMSGFSIALALPFGLFAAFPAWLNTLPQSGGWMTSVKVVLGFLELALAFKFLSVADLTNHWDFLRYELFMAIWVVIFFLMTLYLFGKIKFPHDSPIKKLSLTRKMFAFASAAFTIYLASGFLINEKTGSYNALNLMSGLAPPASYTYFLSPNEVEESIKEKYPSYTMCANNIPCFKDYYEGMNYAKEVDKMPFLDFTGHGCVNCRKVEEHIWVKDEIRDKLIEDCVLISLYVDDDKKIDDVKFSSRDSTYKIRNVGKKWADFQISNFKQNTQPLYVMLTLDEKVIAKPRGYRPDEGVTEYNDYLECGLQTFDTN